MTESWVTVIIDSRILSPPCTFAPKIVADGWVMTWGGSSQGRVTWPWLVMKMTLTKAKERDGFLPHPCCPALSLICHEGDRTLDLSEVEGLKWDKESGTHL